MGKFSKIIFVFLIILGVLIAGRNAIIKFTIEKSVEAATGLPLEIKKIDIGIISTHIGITELSLFNPEGFPEGIMFHAPEIFVDYDLGSIIQGKIHLKDLRLNFDHFVIIKNAEGKMNLEALKPKAKDGSTKSAKNKGDGGKEKGAPKVQIDHLVLKIGKVTYKDYSKGGAPSVREIQVNISEELTDVTDMRSILGLIASRAITKAALNIPIDFTSDIFKNVSGTPKQAVETLKDAANIFKDKIKLPFGNN